MKPTTIIRAAHDKENPYVMLLRAIPQNKSLSFEARGMLAYLLSQPDDWIVQPKDLEQQCGRDKVYRILAELKSAGYLKRERIDRKDKKFEYGDYLVYEIPLPEKPDTGNPETVSPDTENTDALLSIDSSLPSNDKSIQDIDAPAGTDAPAIPPVALPSEEKGSSPQETAKTPETPGSAPPPLPTHTEIVAAIMAWWDTLPVKDATVSDTKRIYGNTTNRSYAVNMLKMGITPEDIRVFVKDQTKPGAFFSDKHLSFAQVAKNLPAWKNKRQPVHVVTKQKEYELTPIDQDVADANMAEFSKKMGLDKMPPLPPRKAAS